MSCLAISFSKLRRACEVTNLRYLETAGATVTGIRKYGNNYDGLRQNSLGLKESVDQTLVRRP